MSEKSIMGAGQMREIADAVRRRIPRGMGFAVLVFHYDAGPASYISNAQRPEIIKALREQADVLERRMDYQTPEAN